MFTHARGRLQSWGGGRILTFPLRYRGYVHTYAERTRNGRGADGSAISWGQWWFGARGFEADAANWVLDPFLAGRILLPLRDRACVNTCNDLCWSQFSARLRPRMCERTLSATTLDVWIISQLDSWSLSNAELSVHRSWSNFHQLF